MPWFLRSFGSVVWCSVGPPPPRRNGAGHDKAVGRGLVTVQVGEYGQALVARGSDPVPDSLLHGLHDQPSGAASVDLGLRDVRGDVGVVGDLPARGRLLLNGAEGGVLHGISSG